MKTETETQHLPQDLLTEILLKCSVKSLVRLKGMCKFWRSLISDPHFARLHFELATPRLMFSTRIYLGLGIQTMALDGSLHSNPISEPINIDFIPTGSCIQILGSCRGFLSLMILEGYESSFHLWSPSTRVHKPIPPCYFHTSLHGYLHGFGYDSSKDDYLVVQVPLILRSSSPISLARVQFFSMRANKWKYIEGINWPRLSLSCSSDRSRQAGLLFNGVIHWLAYDHNKSMDIIIAFDLMEKRLLEIPKPDHLSHGLSSCNLWVYGRFLSLSVMGSNALEIWVMKKYKAQSSWSKTLVLSLSGIPLSPICSTKSGDIVMKYKNKTGGLVKYNDKGEQLEDRSYQGYLESIVPMYTESLFSLPGVTITNENDVYPNCEILGHYQVLNFQNSE